MNLKQIFLIPLIVSAVRNIGGLMADPNCNAINFKAGNDIRTGANDDFLQRPVFNTLEEATRCFKGGAALIGPEKRSVKIPPRLNTCNSESFRAGLNGKYSSRKKLAECSPASNENPKELFPVEEDGQDKQCPADLYKPCAGEATPKYNPCYEKNVNAMKNALKYKGKTIPVYESTEVAEECLPLRARYAVQTENKYSVLYSLDAAEDPTGCLLESLSAGFNDVYPSKETVVKCPPTDDKEKFFRVGKDKKSSTFCTVDPNAKCVEEKIPSKWG